MARETPKPFHMKDLFIDAKLEVVSNGTTFDFLGRKLFSTQFFREGIGFGIINIDIEVNTSLQPLVSITFKDLYGLTVFGGQERNPKGNNPVSHDFSILFDWPPPKFLFSFKGYLGEPVTWVLNLKRTSTSFNSGDGSYELKCEFVPNQWGIFADIPMLFLLAAKSLRRDRIGKKGTLTAEDLKYVTSIFDLIKIGKQVEIKTQDTTKEFDELIKQLGSLKSNIANSLSDSRILKFGSELTGVVNNIKVKGFKKITIPQLASLDSAVNTEEKLSLKISNATSLSSLNTYLLLQLTFDGKSAHGRNFSYAEVLSSNEKTIEITDKAKSQTIAEIDANIGLVEDEIKRRVYSSSKSKLQKITIGEIFSQIGRDAAFIIGSILEAGLKGIRENSVRRTFDDKLIGEAFPLIIKNGEELPATTANFKLADLGVNENEMAFVRKFINAISEGIAKDLLRDDDSSLSEDSSLKGRISNMEMAKGNPYKPFYKDIATNILVRAGIVAWVTRSGDPNLPVDYTNFWGGDNDSEENIIKAATSDAKNITDATISQLSDIDLLLLKRFCRFFQRFYEKNGEYLKAEDGSRGQVISGPGQASTYPVKINSDGDILRFNQLFKELRSEATPQDLKILGAVGFEEEPPISAIQSLSFINPDKYNATKIINNGIGYTVPQNLSSLFFYVLFEGNDNKLAGEVTSSPTDVEYRSEEKDEDTFTIKSDPLGYVPISAVKNAEDEDFGRVKRLRELRDQFLLIDYSKLKTPDSDFYDVNQNSGYSKYLFDKEIYDSREDAIADSKGPGDYVLAGDVGFTVFTNFTDEEYVFDLFTADRRSINQRIYTRELCVLILRQISKFEEERNQVVGSVLGKAAEQETGLYKQMHTLYHQWQSLAYNKKEGDVSEGDLIDRLETAYGGSHTSMVTESDTNGLPDGAFIYEFPLQRISGINPEKGVINVRDSIISLEPLYKINGETSVLNIIQQVCTKNNFLFVPIPGRASYLSVKDLYSPSPFTAQIDVKNFFHVLFTPTPESRVKTRNSDGKLITLSENHKNYDTNSFVIQYGHPDNQIVSNIQVDTDESKNTAESIVNLQRLVDNENQNKVVTTDCSTLPVLQGRSYKVSMDMLGNAQVYPMQFFFLENSPLFGGLYQVMSVKHSITPNNMKTNVSGIRMRFADSYGAVYPVTLKTFEDLGKVNFNTQQAFTETDKENIVKDNATTSTSPSSLVNSCKDIPEQTGLSKSARKIIKSSSTQKDAVSAIIKYLEGGYYHPAMAWDARANKIKAGYTIMKNSGETLYGLDRVAGAWEKKEKGKAFWAKIDAISGYGSYKSQNSTKLTREWNIKAQPLKSNGWGYGHLPNSSEISTLLDDAKGMMEDSFNKNLNSNFKNHPLREIILSDGRLLFMWYRAAWNGSGFFADYARNIKKIYDSGEKNINKLICGDLTYRYIKKSKSFKPGVSKMSYMMDY